MLPRPKIKSTATAAAVPLSWREPWRPQGSRRAPHATSHAPVPVKFSGCPLAGLGLLVTRVKEFVAIKNYLGGLYPAAANCGARAIEQEVVACRMRDVPAGHTRMSVDDRSWKRARRDGKEVRSSAAVAKTQASVSWLRPADYRHCDTRLNIRLSISMKCFLVAPVS